MEDGRDLDILIAEKIFGWTGELIVNCCPLDTLGWRLPGMPNGHHQHHPHYSTNIAAAWQVIETMRRVQHTYISIHPLGDTNWYAEWDGYGQSREGRVYAPTASLAICRAALAAVT